MQNSLWNMRNGGRYTQEFKDSHLCVHKSCGTLYTPLQTLWSGSGRCPALSCNSWSPFPHLLSCNCLLVWNPWSPFSHLLSCNCSPVLNPWSTFSHFLLAIAHRFWTHNCSKDRPSDYQYPSSFCWDTVVVWFSFTKFQHQQYWNLVPESSEAMAGADLTTCKVWKVV